MVLGHLDYLEEAIEAVSAHVEELIAPMADTVDRLSYESCGKARPGKTREAALTEAALGAIRDGRGALARDIAG